MATQTYCTFSYVDDDSETHTFSIRHPIFGWKTTIIMPIDYQKQDGAFYGSYDFGGGTQDYDIRKCICDFILSYADATALMAACAVDAEGRTRTWTMELATNSGFFPFGADKGDAGIFNVSLVPLNDPVTGMVPLRWFKISVELTCINNTYPEYIFPAAQNEGHFRFGTITYCRFPDLWFEPSVAFGMSTVNLPGGRVQYRNMGSSSDAKETNFVLRSKAPKCARILQYLTSVRDNTFSILAPANAYPFGLRAGNVTQTVQLLSGNIEITHEQFNIFNINLTLGKK